jgi:hypothetical protein
VDNSSLPLIVQLNDAQVSQYFDARASQASYSGLVNLVEAKFASNVLADIYGNRPFSGQPSQSAPNEACFARVASGTYYWLCAIMFLVVETVAWLALFNRTQAEIEIGSARCQRVGEVALCHTVGILRPCTQQAAVPSRSAAWLTASLQLVAAQSRRCRRVTQSCRFGSRCRRARASPRQVRSKTLSLCGQTVGSWSGPIGTCRNARSLALLLTRRVRSESLRVDGLPSFDK